jgi:hypothetical protein
MRLLEWRAMREKLRPLRLTESGGKPADLKPFEQPTAAPTDPAQVRLRVPAVHDQLARLTCVACIR